MHIELITTPNSQLKETGFGTQDACQSFVRSAREHEIAVTLTVCASAEDLADVVARRPDLVVLAVKYVAIEGVDDIWLAKFFEKHSIAHTGSTDAHLAFDSNKLLAKLTLLRAGVPSAPFFTATPEEFTHENGIPLPYPVFIKPMDAANGNGVDRSSYATNFSEFERKVDELFVVYPGPVLVEQYLGGAEYTVAILETPSSIWVAPIEVLPPLLDSGIRILGAQVKQDNTELLAKIDDPQLKGRVAKLARRAFLELGATGFARIDIKSDSSGELFFMEINMVPGMTRGTSYFPRAFQMELGLSHSTVVKAMIGSAFERVLGSSPEPHALRDSATFVASASDALNAKLPLPIA